MFPRTFVNRNGAIFDATKTKIIYAEDLNFLTKINLSNVRAFLSGSVVTASGKINFDAVSFDGLSEFDYTTDHRFIAQNDGYYQVSFAMRCLVITDIGLGHISILKNGAEVSYLYFLPSAGVTYTAVMTDTFKLNAGDYLELSFELNTGSMYFIGDSSGVNCPFCIKRIA